MRDNSFDRDAVFDLIRTNLGQHLMVVERYLSERGKDIASMGLMDLFHEVDHIITDLYEERRNDGNAVLLAA